NYSSTALNGTTTLTVACSLLAPYTVGLDAGSGAGATIATRRMTNGANTLQYKLFSDPGRTINIGQTVGTDTVSGNGTGVAQTITIYGQILPSQLTTPGLYSDSVIATITY
ncbi:MAG: spore coat protein U domain-containing protein, partial [Pseudomonadota bacterium]|nr:spore coat protein U domain-containing protein [Pseudomonadota bacterium]